MNYFNYFTEVEEHFQRARGSGLFLLSPLDWAMIETWKEAGLPLEAVHKGIDRAFEKWHARKHKTKMVNSLAYCAQEVLTAAREMEDVDDEGPTPVAAPAFQKEELAHYFRQNAKTLRTLAATAAQQVGELYQETATSLEQLAFAAEEGQLTDLESIEMRLTVLEERLIAAVMQRFREEELLEARREMERQLAPYRRKMSSDQLAALEKQYLLRKCMEVSGLPRLSLFYL